MRGRPQTHTHTHRETLKIFKIEKHPIAPLRGGIFEALLPGNRPPLGNKNHIIKRNFALFKDFQLSKHLCSGASKPATVCLITFHRPECKEDLFCLGRISLLRAEWKHWE